MTSIHTDITTAGHVGFLCPIITGSIELSPPINIYEPNFAHWDIFSNIDLGFKYETFKIVILYTINTYLFLLQAIFLSYLRCRKSFHCCSALDKSHNDIIKWKHFLRYWPFVRRIHWSPANSPHKGQWCGAMMFSLICAWTYSWVNNHDAGVLRRHRTHYMYDVTTYLMYNAVHLVTILPSQRTSTNCNIGVSREVLEVSAADQVRVIIRMWWDNVSWDYVVRHFAMICGWSQT